jgi:hypothetical protein
MDARPIERSGMHLVPGGSPTFLLRCFGLHAQDIDCKLLHLIRCFQCVAHTQAHFAGSGWFDMANVLHHVLAANRHLSVTK